MRLIRENDTDKDELLFSRLQKILPAHRKELTKQLTQEEFPVERRADASDFREAA
jgi:hypothetical protein